MSNTIEELAKQYAKYQTDERGYGSMEEWRQGVAIYYDDAKEVLSWLFNKSLALRLTTEEKESVRKEHNWAKVNLSQLKEGRFNELDPDVVLCSGVIRTLNRIFGADFFKEK